MDSNRKTAITAGVLYIAGTAAGIISVAFGTDLDAPDFLASLSANKDKVFIQALFEFTMSILTVGIPIILYPILKKYNEALAFGHVVFRTIETIIFTIGAITLLLILTLSQKFAFSGAPDASYFQTFASLLLAVRELGGGVFAVLVFSLSALFLNYILYQSELIPRWSSGWGLIGASLYLGSGFLPLFGYDTRSTFFLLMEAPFALWEMFFALWLIFKGFNPSAIASESAKQI